MNSNKYQSTYDITCQYRTELQTHLNKGQYLDGVQNNELFEKFFQEFFAYIPVDYIDSANALSFAGYASEAFALLNLYEAQEIKVKIKQSKDSLCIYLLQSDCSFIVDSLKLLLARQGITIQYLFHPVIHVKRNQAGELLDVGDTQGGREESLVVAEIRGIKSEGAINNLHDEIVRLMKMVQKTAGCWQLMHQKCSDVVKDLASSDSDEIIEFLTWLQEKRFTFLSYLEYDFSTMESRAQIASENIVGYDVSSLFHKIGGLPNNQVVFGRIDRLSEIHRNSFLDFVAIKLPDSHQNDFAIFFGLPESTLGYQSIRRIPIIREKLQLLLEGGHFAYDGYNSRKVTMILEALPREVLFQSDLEELAIICHHALSAMISCKIKLFLRSEFTGRFINSLLFIHKDRLSPEVQQEILEYLSEALNANVTSSVVRRIGESYVVFSVNLLLDNTANTVDVVQQLNSDEIQCNIDNMTKLWSQTLLEELQVSYDDLHQVKSLYRAMLLIYPHMYREIYSSQDAINDYEYLLKAAKRSNVVFNLQFSAEEQFFSLKVYSPDKNITLSSLMPAVENLGFVVSDYRSFDLHHSAETKHTKLYEYRLVVSQGHSTSNILAHKAKIEEALEQIILGRLAINKLCSLVAIGGLSWRQVTLIKALSRYLHQTGFTYGVGYVQRVLITHYQFVSDLVELFELRFHPEKQQKTQRAITKLHKTLDAYLTNVINSAEDKVLRHMLGIVDAMLRTNYYQYDKEGMPKTYASFKFDSKRIPELPRPHPFAEIFVFSSDFEAVHLRGGPVSRGGLRWSDRSEDYRVEVLGLMKAQNTKNTVIVPEGSKGGFCLKFSPDPMSRDEYMAKAIECYTNFLRGMLDITDNIVDGVTISPQNVICHDKPDPYLVVAADKGTATFSDYANQVATQEYNFWLGDAFASGGSAGYDHKKMGITSKGAWISVANHFSAMDVDVAKDPITVVGIGDMSGDVFGNGMLSSKAIKLVAAFNHRNIFIDPDPDPKTSFKERQRLFNKAGSTWQDYNPKLLSKGAVIYSRSSKKIKLSKEAAALLDLDVAIEWTPNQIINAILKAEVDLIWNGGIGTYVKSTQESHLDIGDKANDEVRCSASELRCKVIGEGGNLGMSQKSRIEFARLGGRVNTDFIDNSAGVDCSDHEVNIKIILNQALSDGEITIEERNDFLASMTDDVEKLVLRDNFKQNQSLNISETSAMATIEMYSRLLQILESEEGLLDREVEFLPSKEEMKKLHESGQRLTRPERAVIFSYSKMSVYNELLPTKVADDPYCDKYLSDYFPQQMQERFKERILKHSLRREIITTILTNRVVNQLGGPILALIKRETGALVCDIVRSYIIICDIFELDKLWAEVENLSGHIEFSLQTQLFNDISRIMRRGIVWLLKNLQHPIDIIHTSTSFKTQAHDLTESVSGLLVGGALAHYKSKHQCYVKAGIRSQLAGHFASLDSLISSFDIIKIAQTAKASHCEVAHCYFAVGDIFHMYWLRENLEKIAKDSYWQRLSVQSIKDDLYESQKRLTLCVITAEGHGDVKKWLNEHFGQYVENYMSFINDLLTQEEVDLNMVIIANKKLEMFLKKVSD